MTDAEKKSYDLTDFEAALYAEIAEGLRGIYRLGVIGSGSIVPFHLDAAIAAGFEIVGIGSRAGSEKTAALAQRYQAKVYEDWRAVLQAGRDGEIDALLIAPETSVTRSILAEAMNMALPILVEKPAAYSSFELEPLLNKATVELVLVGYNRRHYSSVAAAKAFIQQNENIVFHAAIPEASWSTETTAEKRQQILLSNTVHVLDLLNYLFDDLQPQLSAGIDDEVGYFSRNSIMVSPDGHNGTVMITFGSPSNYFIDLHTQGRSASLRPIEIYREFDGVEVFDPTAEVPLRHYQPTEAQVYLNGQPGFTLSQADLDFKPGFLSQFIELRAMVDAIRTGNLDVISETRASLKSASLFDAVRVLKLAEGLR